MPMFIFVIIAQSKQDNYIANKQQMEISIALCCDKEMFIGGWSMAINSKTYGEFSL
jgi:hypothetical protein